MFVRLRGTHLSNPTCLTHAFECSNVSKNVSNCGDP